MKKRTSVYIDADLLDFAKKEKLNLSKLLEEAIKLAKSTDDSGRTRASRARCPGSNPGGRILLLIQEFNLDF